MNPSTVDAIMGVLERHPAGFTAKDTAAELGWKEANTSLRMGKLSYAGTIARSPVPGRTNNRFLYRLKAVVAPPTAPASTWAPAVTLIARRMIHA